MKQILSSKIVLVIIIISVGATLGVAGYLIKNNLSKNAGKQSITKSERTISSGEEKNKDKTNKFKFGEAKVGDKIVGMVIKFIKPFSSDVITPTKDNVSAGFSGEATISGKYHYYGDDPSGFLSNTVCFDNLDEQSQAKIPKMTGDDRNVWFCFSNQELARNLFKPQGTSGAATIVIDDYVINILPAEVTNTAKLIKVKVLNK